MVDYYFALAHFCETHGPVAISYTRKNSRNIKEDLINNEDCCNSCKLVYPGTPDNKDDKISYVASEYEVHGVKQRFVSSKKIMDPAIEEKLQSITVRCLSEESNSKICFFGDKDSMFSMSRSFKLRDSMARGKSRKYALILTCDSQKKLLENFSKINEYFHYIIKNLKKRQISLLNNDKNMVLNKEDTENYDVAYSSSSDFDDCGVVDYKDIIWSQKIILRNLADILEDSSIYAKIHVMATNLLGELYYH